MYNWKKHISCYSFNTFSTLRIPWYVLERFKKSWKRVHKETWFSGYFYTLCRSVCILTILMLNLQFGQIDLIPGQKFESYDPSFALVVPGICFSDSLKKIGLEVLKIHLYDLVIFYISIVTERILIHLIQCLYSFTG